MAVLMPARRCGFLLLGRRTGDERSGEDDG
jgi:hypothetical protein